MNEPRPRARYNALERTRNRLPLFFRTDGEPVVINRIIRAVILEYIATGLFVFYACGSVVASQVYDVPTVAQNLFAAIIQGFAIATLVYAIAHTSGGHINPAVTLAFMISNNIGIIRGLFYMAAQFLGAITGAALLSAFLPGPVEGGLGTTGLGIGTSPFQAYLFEFMITFALLFTIFGTAMNKEAAASGTAALAPLPIGFSITVGVGIAYQFTGGSMNPARTFGPAVISHTWAHNYIYWFGPFTAALLVGVVERYFELFSQGQHAVFRATTERNRNLLRQAAVKARRGSSVPLGIGAPMDLGPVDPSEPDTKMRSPVAAAPRRKSNTSIQFAELPASSRVKKPRKGSLNSSPRGQGYNFGKRKMSLIRPFDYDDSDDDEMLQYVPTAIPQLVPRSNSVPAVAPSSADAVLSTPPVPATELRAGTPKASPRLAAVTYSPRAASPRLIPNPQFKNE